MSGHSIIRNVDIAKAKFQYLREIELWEVMLVQFQQYVEYYAMWSHIVHSYDGMLPCDSIIREIMWKFLKFTPQSDWKHFILHSKRHSTIVWNWRNAFRTLDFFIMEKNQVNFE